MIAVPERYEHVVFIPKTLKLYTFKSQKIYKSSVMLLLLFTLL